jgi:hypothetical protein
MTLLTAIAPLNRQLIKCFTVNNGQVTDNKVTELKRLVENNNLKTVTLALDNNLEGHLFDTRLIVCLARPATPMGIVRTLPGLITVAIHSVQDEPVSRLHRDTKAYNQQVLESYRKVAGPEAVPGPTLDIEVIKVSKVGDHSYQLHVPKRLETLAAFNQSLINAFPMVAKVELEKSKANDWNDQLKEQLKEKTRAVGRSLVRRRNKSPARAVGLVFSRPQFTCFIHLRLIYEQ